MWETNSLNMYRRNLNGIINCIYRIDVVGKHIVHIVSVCKHYYLGIKNQGKHFLLKQASRNLSYLRFLKKALLEVSCRISPILNKIEDNKLKCKIFRTNLCLKYKLPNHAYKNAQ